MHALVARDQHQLGSPVEVRPVVDVALSQHLEERLAGLGVRDRLELAREPLGEGRVVARAGRLAQVDLAAGGEAVGARAAEVDVGERAVGRGPGHEAGRGRRAGRTRSVVRASRPSASATLRSRPAQEPLERPAPVAQVAGPPQPLVGVERPVDRLHAVVGHDDALSAPRRTAARAASISSPQTAVDRLVDLHQLVAGVRRVVGRMARVEARVAEMAGEVGAHEVDREHAQVGLELEARPARLDRSGRRGGSAWRA